MSLTAPGVRIPLPPPSDALQAASINDQSGPVGCPATGRRPGTPTSGWTAYGAGLVVDRRSLERVGWRREGDSNPRSREAQRFSRPSQSSTLPSLRRAAYRRGYAVSRPPVASVPEERWPSQVEGAPLLREYGPKSSSWVRIPPSPPTSPTTGGWQRAARRLERLRS